MNVSDIPLTALLACRNAAGSANQMARDLHITQPTVWRWLNRSRRMPAEYVLKAERLYGVSRHDLRPDIYPRDYSPAPQAGRKRRDLHRLSAGAK